MLMFVFVWIIGFVQSDECFNDSSNGASRSFFCCNNHEKKNGACVECVIGYVSKEGFPCKPCSYGLWGRRCSYMCRCHQNERCDIVYGCVEVTTVMLEKFGSTEPKNSAHVLTTPHDSFTAADKNDVVRRKNDIIIYIICVGSSAAIFAVASRCFKNKRKVDKIKKSSSPRKNHDQVSDHANVQYDNESSVYDSIGEDKLICNERSEHANEFGIILSTIVDLDANSHSYNEGHAADLSKGVYSNTCQYMIEVDVHNYSHSMVESTQKSSELSLERSTKSIVDAPKENNGFHTDFKHKFPSH